jgi:hypothetical protein
MIEQFIKAKNANVPLLAINTPDPASTIKKVTLTHPEEPIAQWDVINGLVSLTQGTLASVNQINTLIDGTTNGALATGNPIECLIKISGLPNGTILFFHNTQMFMDKLQPGNTLATPVIQAIWNLRDIFRKKKSMLVMLSPHLKLPEELEHDVLMIEEPLPNEEDLAGIVARAFAGTGLRKPRKSTMPQYVNAISGLATFPAFQIIRMSIQKSRTGKPKIDLDNLWKQKIDKIESTQGLKIHRTGPRFDDIGGMENIKDMLRRIARSATRPRIVVFIDEIEKAMAAAGRDTSGVVTDQLKVLLTDMQNNNWTGCIIYGFPGTGKSQLAKAFGHEAGALTVEADLGAMKNIWVGSSEARMRGFMKIIKAMGDTKVFFMATCNHVEILRPELRRRFKHGIWFSDLPENKVREAIWNIYLKKYQIPQQELPDDKGWTGAEIEVCCERAKDLGIQLKDAVRFMTILSQNMGDDVNRMREAASGKYVSVEHAGTYTYKPAEWKHIGM